MPDGRRRTCRVCGRHESEVGPISWSGKCTQHGLEALEANVTQMIDRRGPNWDAWRRSMVLCAYPELADALPKRS